MVGPKSIDELLNDIDLALYALECAADIATRDGLCGDAVEDETSRLGALIHHIVRPARDLVGQASGALRTPGSVLLRVRG